MPERMTRRTAFATMAAGCTALQFPLPIGDANAAAPADMGPNDQRIWRLYRRWVEINAESDAIAGKSEAIEATLPADLRRDTLRADLEALVEAGQAGADQAHMDELRRSIFKRTDRAREIRSQAGQDALDEASERLGSERLQLEEQMAQLRPETPHGAVPLIRILDYQREFDPHQPIDYPPLVDMAFNVMALVRQQAGEA